MDEDPTVAACQVRVDDLDVDANLARVADRLAGVDAAELAHDPDDLVVTLDAEVLATQRDLVDVPVGEDCDTA